MRIQRKEVAIGQTAVGGNGNEKGKSEVPEVNGITNLKEGLQWDSFFSS